MPQRDTPPIRFSNSFMGSMLLAIFASSITIGISVFKWQSSIHDAILGHEYRIKTIEDNQKTLYDRTEKLTNALYPQQFYKQGHEQHN